MTSKHTGNFYFLSHVPTNAGNIDLLGNDVPMMTNS